MTTYLSGNRKNKLVLDRYPAVGRIVNRSAQIKRKELQMKAKIYIDGKKYRLVPASTYDAYIQDLKELRSHKPKPLLADAQVGWVCRRRDGEWVQIEEIDHADHPVCYTIGETTYRDTGKYHYMVKGTEENESPSDIIHTESLAEEGTAEWMKQMLLLGNKVKHCNHRIPFCLIDGIIYHYVKDEYGIYSNLDSFMEYASAYPTGWRIYEPETAKETELFAGIKKGDIVSITAPCGSVVRKATVVSDKSFWVDDPCDYEFSKLTGRTSHIGLYAIKPDPAEEPDIDKFCTECNGAGKMWMHIPRFADVEEDCPHCHGTGQEPAKSPAYEVGDWVEMELRRQGNTEIYHAQINYATDTLFMIDAYPSVYTFSLFDGKPTHKGSIDIRATRKLSPSQVVLDFGAFSGTIRKIVATKVINEITRERAFVDAIMIKTDSFGRCLIPIDAIKDKALQSTVKSLLAAIEKETKNG